MARFLDHVNVVLGRLRQDSITTLSTDTSSIPYRVQLSVQRAIARVWNARQWTFRQTKDTLSVPAYTSAGTDILSLPKRVGSIYLVTSTVSPYLIRPKAEEDLVTRVPNPVSTGNPQWYSEFEEVGADNQPSSASVLSLSSSSASDTTQKVRIRGVVSGEEDVEEVTLNGTTAVLTTKSFSSIRAITKSAQTAGRVTVTSNSGTVTNLVLGPLETVVRLKKVRAYPFPSSAATWTIWHFAQPYIPSADNDDSGIPSRWDYVVEQWAFALALQPQGQDQLNEQAAQFALASQYLENDMASEEVQSTESVIQPRRGLDTGTVNQGFLDDDQGRGFEEGEGY